MEKNCKYVKGKLVKMIKNAGSKFDDYSIWPKIRQILLHWGYELTKQYFLMSWWIINKNESFRRIL